ncbi:MULTISPECIES: ATP-dependent DNA helicase RecG [Methylomonas]|uniref:ATP-dependent DNA helicase RecG n=2 Tax=Methylomonas TaxID=416 RepID=A0A140E3G2_9GAMM|nr:MULTISPECIES: ATP-dependent DNA helicase RecG [Methylomonas]AMK74936.1 ATP-dependent DNA helicase RecG [Methylomonas denitrificans]OAI05799.1 ATP-dependent DNA helicase RecG [Methylomonas methanica]TCV80993.1 ATP-dependent DNA helicase RecG [Methylomonas methanica]
MNHPEPHKQPVTALTGIGPQSAARLEKLGIHTLQDLLFHLPLRYQDRSRIVPISHLLPGMTTLVCGTVEFTDSIQRGRPSVICRIADDSGSLSIRFFHFTVQQSQQLKPGTLLGCFGEIRYGYNGLEMVHPEYKIVAAAEQLLEATLTPVYPLTEGISQSALRKAIKQALTLCLASDSAITDWLPANLLTEHGYPSLNDALQTLHNPPPHLSAEIINGGSLPALKRLVFEEFLAHHLALLQGKLAYKSWQSPVFDINQAVKQAFLEGLPFQLTAAQQRVTTEIESDCRLAQPMLRLVQGDVGSGKTVVAALASLLALNSGYQVAIMAPTELLAEQHFRNFSLWFAETGHQVLFLTGQLKGKSRQATLDALADGSANIVIGTHALFQESVHFHKLGLIVIDEQHRFGVHQRLALREKGQHGGLRPHQLIMTATPIPRTLAMLQYSDLDISIIDELPPGRKPIATSVISSERREEVIGRIEHWVAQQRQAYWVCTLIEESEVLQCEAAEKTAAYLCQTLPNVRVGLVHGRMKAAEKDAVMHAFKNRDCDLLVATTVIEVGVDVPNAGLMIIENPERLGLSQLHQLRGRVGRGNQDSYCLLLYQAPLSQAGKQRLAILKESNDGFVIAEKDLELRGPGEVMGTRQTGQIQFKIADLERDSGLLELIPAAAQLIHRHHPDAIQPLIQRWIGHSRHYAEV